ncbi:hypothetical protein D3C72_2073840 [compost metagenome]
MVRRWVDIAISTWLPGSAMSPSVGLSLIQTQTRRSRIKNIANTPSTSSKHPRYTMFLPGARVIWNTLALISLKSSSCRNTGAP